MTVRKFRSVEEMNQDRWRHPGDPELYRAIADVWALGARTGIHRFPPGVYRHRTIEDLNRLTESWQAANFEAFQELRRKCGD